jgi:hypothetical protein
MLKGTEFMNLEASDDGVFHLVLLGFYFTLLHSIQTGSEAHPAFHPTTTRDSFLRGKVARA